MVPFSSPRERKLWTWVAAVVLAIYVTLGLAGTLAGRLAVAGLLEVSFALAFLVVILAVVGHALSRRPRSRSSWLVAGVLAVYAMVLVRMGVPPADRTHLFEYGLVAVLIHEAVLERKRNGGRIWFPAGVAVLSTAVLGWIDEGIQGLIPNRSYELRDVGVNALAGFVAVAAGVGLSVARRARFFARGPGRRRRTHRVP